MNCRPGPSVRDDPSPLPPVPIDSARPSAAWDTGLWQVAQAMSRFPLRILSNRSAWPRSTSAGAWSGVGPIGTTPDLPRLCRSSASSDKSEEHTSELQSRVDLVCRLLLEKKKKQ